MDITALQAFEHKYNGRARKRKYPVYIVDIPYVVPRILSVPLGKVWGLPFLQSSVLNSPDTYVFMSKRTLPFFKFGEVIPLKFPDLLQHAAAQVKRVELVDCIQSVADLRMSVAYSIKYPHLRFVELSPQPSYIIDL